VKDSEVGRRKTPPLHRGQEYRPRRPHHEDGVIKILIDETRLPELELTEEIVRRIILRNMNYCTTPGGGDATKLFRTLFKSQNGLCAICSHPMDEKTAHLEHRKTIREFAYDLSIPLTDAIEQAWALENMRVTHARCNYDRKKATA